jgi:hypothetical protein
MLGADEANTNPLRGRSCTGKRVKHKQGNKSPSNLGRWGEQPSWGLDRFPPFPWLWFVILRWRVGSDISPRRVGSSSFSSTHTASRRTWTCRTKAKELHSLKEVSSGSFCLVIVSWGLFLLSSLSLLPLPLCFFFGRNTHALLKYGLLECPAALRPKGTAP